MPYTGGSADANPIYGPTAINTDDLRAVDLADAAGGIDPTAGGGSLPSGGDVGDVVTNTAPGTGTWQAPSAGGDHAPTHEAGGADPITNLGYVAFKAGADIAVEIIDDPDSAGNPRLRILNPATGDAWVEAGLTPSGFPGVRVLDGGFVVAHIGEQNITLGDPQGTFWFQARNGDGISVTDGTATRTLIDVDGKISLGSAGGVGAETRVAIAPDGTGVTLSDANAVARVSIQEDTSVGGIILKNAANENTAEIIDGSVTVLGGGISTSVNLFGASWANPLAETVDFTVAVGTTGTHGGMTQLRAYDDDAGMAISQLYIQDNANNPQFVFAWQSVGAGGSLSGVFGATPYGQDAFVPDPTGAATDTDDEARAAIIAIRDTLVLRGWMAAV